MSGLHKLKVNLGFLINPFYLYCIAFSLSIFVYMWGWSDIFPRLSVGLILFFVFSFVVFIFAGYMFRNKDFLKLNQEFNYSFINDIIFAVILFLGTINVLFMGYLPILDRSHNYREFGVPVIDPVFNTLSIFFSVFYFQTFLQKKKKRFLIYVFVILLVQILIFRRSTIMWIVASSTFLYLIYSTKIKLFQILVCLLCIPFLSYCFGLYGITRSNLSEAFVLNDLGASNTFKKSGISYNHYMTYLYVSSPLANLQENINAGNGLFNNKTTNDFILYSVIPQSITIRLEKIWSLSPPAYNLITSELIAGGLFMVSFYTMGWPGMIFMLLYLSTFIVLCLFIIKKWSSFGVTTYAILCTTVCLSIFSNFLNRADVLLMLFVYPVLFHFLFKRSNRFLSSGVNMTETNQHQATSN
jgi:hypothetical protein